MKKILFRLLGINSKSTSAAQRLANRKISKTVEHWVKQRGFTGVDSAMEDVADEMDITKEELSFYCAETLKKPFLTWRKELRIKEAQRLMEESPDCPVSAIAENVGIKSASNFRKQFQEVCGITPKEWKALNGWKKGKK